MPTCTSTTRPGSRIYPAPCWPPTERPLTSVSTRWRTPPASRTRALSTNAGRLPSERWRSAGTDCRACANNPTATPLPSLPRVALSSMSSAAMTISESMHPRRHPTTEPPPEPDTDPDPEPEPDTDPDPAPAPDTDCEPDTDPDPDTDPEPATGAAPESAAAPVGDAAAQRRSLVGQAPPLLPKPWYTYSWSGLVAALSSDPGEHCPGSPAVILGGAVLPAPIAAQVAAGATIRPLIHPGQAPPEPRYRPSNALAEFVRCRDLTCRFPGCNRPATVADLDHTTPWPYGPTCASNLKCLCREHHLLKTFWPGWHDKQLPDGTVIWTDPDGHTYITHPGSRQLFPELCLPTAEAIVTGTPPAKRTDGPTMPRRSTTRAGARRQRVDDERRRNAPATEQYLRDSVPPF